MIKALEEEEKKHSPVVHIQPQVQVKAANVPSKTFQYVDRTLHQENVHQPANFVHEPIHINRGELTKGRNKAHFIKFEIKKPSLFFRK